MNPQTSDVLIVGAGPVGLTLANLLGTYGVRTTVIERNTALEAEPRAVTLDDESLRTLQCVGLLEPVLADVVLGYGVEYFDWRGRPFAKIRPTREEYGFPKRNAFRQPLLLQTLWRGLSRFAHVDLRFEHTFIGFVQDAGGVQVQVEVNGAAQTLGARWVVACDGGRSPVREACGIALEGQTYAERWLIVDLAERTTALRHARTYCDPRRPTIRLPGPHGSLRYEFMLRPYDRDEDVLDETRFRRWIGERVPQDQDLPLVRKVIYGFHARVAARWREGRIFFAGDAAHLTPPFAGQGLNSGIRDAANLSWKLVAVLVGALPDTVLDSYEQERRPHARALINMALRIGKVMQPKTMLGAAFVQTALRAACLLPTCRDYILQLKFKPKPAFVEGFFVTTPRLWRAELAPQPMVERQSRQMRLDKVLGNGFAVIARDAHVLAHCAVPMETPEMPVRRIVLVCVNEDILPGLDTEVLPHVRDLSGVLTQFMERFGAQAMVLRPDRYVYSVVSSDAVSTH